MKDSQSVKVGGGWYRPQNLEAKHTIKEKNTIVQKNHGKEAGGVNILVVGWILHPLSEPASGQLGAAFHSCAAG